VVVGITVKNTWSLAQWLIAIIPAALEAEIRRIVV
jgi:hypothetical protein